MLLEPQEERKSSEVSPTEIQHSPSLSDKRSPAVRGLWAGEDDLADEDLNRDDNAAAEVAQNGSNVLLPAAPVVMDQESSELEPAAPPLPPLAVGIASAHVRDEAADFNPARTRVFLAKGDQERFALLTANPRAQIYFRGDMKPNLPAHRYCLAISANDYPPKHSKLVDFIVQEDKWTVLGKIVEWECGPELKTLSAHLSATKSFDAVVKTIKNQLGHLFEIEQSVNKHKLADVQLEIVILLPKNFAIEHGRLLMAKALDMLKNEFKHKTINDFPYFRLMETAGNWTALSEVLTAPELLSFLPAARTIVDRTVRQAFFQKSVGNLDAAMDHIRRHLMNLGNAGGWSQLICVNVETENDKQQNLQIYEFQKNSSRNVDARITTTSSEQRSECEFARINAKRTI